MSPDVLFSLHDRRFRDRHGLFLTEGVRFVTQAAAHGWEIVSLIVVPKMLRHAFGVQLARRLTAQGIPCREVTPEVFLKISHAEEPQWIAAVVRQRWLPLESLRPGWELCWIALDTVRSPGNLGTILRTSDAVGAGGVLIVGPEIDPFAPAVVRATMGSLFGQRFVRTQAKEMRAWADQWGAQIVGTSPSARTDFREAAYAPPTVFWMGGERKGLSADQQSLCDLTVRIPMVGRADSLNLAVSAGIVLYEAFRQRPLTAKRAQ